MLIKKFKIVFLVNLFFLLIISFKSVILAKDNLICQNFYSFSGNKKYNSTSKSFNYTTATNKLGKSEINLGFIGSVNNFNPYALLGAQPNNYYTLYFDTLFISPLDDINVFYPLLATNICFANIKPSNKNYNSSFMLKITLNNNAKWSDNSKITSNDVLFTFNTLKLKSFDFYRSIFKDINYIEIIDDENIIFYLNNNNKDLLSLIFSSPIISYNFFKNIDFVKPMINVPVSSGAYFIKIINNSHIQFIKNENYWAKNLWVRSNQFNFNVINYFYFSSQNALNNALLNNVIDVLEINDNFAEHIFTNSVLKNNNLKSLQILNKYKPPLNALFFNTQTINLELRKILFNAYNTNEINKNLYNFNFNNNNVFFNLQNNNINNNDLIATLKNNLKELSNNKNTINIVITSNIQPLLHFINNLKMLNFTVNITFANSKQLNYIKNNYLYDIIEESYLFADPIGSELLFYFTKTNSTNYNLNNINNENLNNFILKYLQNQIDENFNKLGNYIKNQYLFIPLLKKDYKIYIIKDNFIINPYAIQNNIVDLFSWQKE